MSVQTEMCRTFGPDMQGRSCHDCTVRDAVKGCRLYSASANRLNPYGLACARYNKPPAIGEIPLIDRRGPNKDNGPCIGQLDMFGGIVGE